MITLRRWWVGGGSYGSDRQLGRHGCGRSSSSTRRSLGLGRFLDSQKLLGTESFIMDMSGSFNKILQVGSSQKVTQVHKFAVMFILDIDNTPTSLSATYSLAIHDHVSFRTDNSKRDELLLLLLHKSQISIYTIAIHIIMFSTYTNVFVQCTFLFIILITFVRIQTNVVESKLSLDLYESRAMSIMTFHRQIKNILTRCLKASRSSKVKESDLAMTGTTLTTSESFLSTTISMGFNL